MSIRVVGGIKKLITDEFMFKKIIQDNALFVQTFFLILVGVFNIFPIIFIYKFIKKYYLKLSD
jgi:hypothetical protein